VVHAAPGGGKAAIDTVAEAFGGGFGLKGAVIEMVKDGEITRGIEKVIPGIANPQLWNKTINALPWERDRFLAGTAAFARGLD
jgi:hypothetical protein